MSLPPLCHATLPVQYYEGGVEIVWSIPYRNYPRIAASLSGPAEGGLEGDGDPHPISVTYYPNGGEELSFDPIQEGSILGLLLVAKYGYPDVVDCQEAMADDYCGYPHEWEP